jgi:hypothetical protein
MQIWDYKVMLIFLAFLLSFFIFFSTFVFMRSKLFRDKPETIRTGSERWVRIFPDSGEGHRLYDPLEEQELGRILFDPAGNWIYDGEILSVDEQEEVAGLITGHRREMNELIRDL